MKCGLFGFAAALFAAASFAQDSAKPTAPKTSGSYATDIVTVRDAQSEALGQAKQALADAEDAGIHSALETAIKEMERAEAALDAAKNSPDKLGPALTAEQTAYQALLKAIPREYRVSRSRNRQSGNGAGQPNPRQMDQLDMKEEANRYETERQASSTQTQQQREQSEIANRLKELAQRQQDLNDRLRELQTALQAAKTDEERADIERQLKRLRDEERQMLADLDQLRQRMEQSPNANANAEARQQLDQTRSDVQRAAQEIERQSPSEALAAGTRAQQQMQQLRDNLRRQSSSHFSEQMRQLRSQARDLAKQEDEIANKLDSAQNGERKLDNSADNQQIADQLAKQESALTNIMSSMRAISEQSENIEPLLSQKLYDTLRRADQRRTDNLLEMGAQLAQRGFLPQTSEVERSARTNINELRRGIESAAESVLGNETEALRFAERELDDLTRQLERELPGGTNATQADAARAGARGGTNQAASATAGRGQRDGAAREGTNATFASANGQAENRESQQRSGDSQRGQGNEQNSADSQSDSQNGNQSEQVQNGQQGQGGGDNPGNAQAQNRQGGQGQETGDNSSREQNGQAGGQLGGRDRLTQLARQLNGGADNGFNNGGEYGPDRRGPLTGGDYLNWADRLRDVEQALDSPDLRDQLATVRDRASALRQQFRQSQRPPNEKVVREQLIMPMTQVRVWLQQELARQENANSLAPLDRDPVPDNYSELVRKYYEKLGSAQ